MKFGAVPPREAEGAIAVHSIRKGGMVLKKGTLIGKSEIAALEAAKVSEIVVARLEPGDVSEDIAAAEIAAAVAGEGVHVDRAFTGRANLFAEEAGVLVVDKERIDALNDVDPSITFATLDAYAPVVAGKMIATVKIIPFAVAGAARDKALAAARGGQRIVRVAPFKVRKVGIISTVLPGLADKVIEKTLKVTQERLAPAGAVIVAERRVPHETKALAKALDEVLKAGAEMVVVFGASAIADTRDVIPAAVEAVGGRIEHFGMPVDPGNLMLVAEANGKPVLGAPGCARSPKENGFDWILMRLLAGLPIKRSDITGLGVGGLLDGDRDAAATARRARAGEGPSDRGPGACGGPLHPYGRAEQAARGDQRQGAGADRDRACARLARAAGDRRDRSPEGARRARARRSAGHVRAQSGFRRGALDLAQGRHRGCAGGGGWRCGLPRRHAAGQRRARSTG